MLKPRLHIFLLRSAHASWAMIAHEKFIDWYVTEYVDIEFITGASVLLKLSGTTW